MQHLMRVCAAVVGVTATACGNTTQLDPDFVTFHGTVTTGAKVVGAGRVTVDEVGSRTDLETTLAKDGSFAIDIADDQISVCTGAWEYVDPSTRAMTPWRYGHRWCTMKDDARYDPHVFITPYSQLVHKYAERLARGGGATQLYEVWERSKTLHQAFFGCAMPDVDLTAVEPVDIASPDASRTLSAGVYLGATIAALSEMAVLANQYWGWADTTRVTLLDVIDAFGEDGADGLYDGRVGTRSVTLGGRVPYDGLRSGPTGLLTALRRVLEAESNQSGIRADDVRDWFQCLADYDGAMTSTAVSGASSSKSRRPSCAT
jgi:hypothetical protein